MDLRREFGDALVCPDCRVALHGDNDRLRCDACASAFERHSGAWKLWPPSRAAEIDARIRGFAQPHAGVRQSPLFRALLPPSPVCDPDRRRREERVSAALRGKRVVNLGSKADVWGAQVVNLDLVPPRDGRIDILADIEHLPFADGSLDGVICTYVLEHVADAGACIREIARVVKPGGHVYITVPFVFPTHPDPLDRWRWTLDGLRHAFGAFEEIEAGTCGGPFSGLVACVPTQMGSAFSSFYVFNAVRTLLGWLMWPLKFLDLLAWRSTRAHMAPANFYFWGRRSETRTGA